MYSYLFTQHLFKESAIDMWAPKCTFKKWVDSYVTVIASSHPLCLGKAGMTLSPPIVKQVRELCLQLTWQVHCDTKWVCFWTISFGREANYGSKVSHFECIAAEFFLGTISCKYKKLEILV